MSLTIKHPDTAFEGNHSGLEFVDGEAEIAALDAEAREPLIANGFTIDGEDDVPETPEQEADRLASEQKAADEAAAKKAADEKAAADKAKAAEAKAAKK